LPLIAYVAMVGQVTDSCTKYGQFFLIMPLMGILLLVCYCWGRYYANKLDYAQTINRLLEDTDE